MVFSPLESSAVTVISLLLEVVKSKAMLLSDVVSSVHDLLFSVPSYDTVIFLSFAYFCADTLATVARIALLPCISSVACLWMPANVFVSVIVTSPTTGVALSAEYVLPLSYVDICPL